MLGRSDEAGGHDSKTLRETTCAASEVRATEVEMKRSNIMMIFLRENRLQVEVRLNLSCLLRLLYEERCREFAGNMLAGLGAGLDATSRKREIIAANSGSKWCFSWQFALLMVTDTRANIQSTQSRCVQPVLPP